MPHQGIYEFYRIILFFYTVMLWGLLYCLCHSHRLRQKRKKGLANLDAPLLNKCRFLWSVRVYCNDKWKNPACSCAQEVTCSTFPDTLGKRIRNLWGQEVWESGIQENKFPVSYAVLEVARRQKWRVNGRMFRYFKWKSLTSTFITCDVSKSKDRWMFFFTFGFFLFSETVLSLCIYLFCLVYI